MSFADESLPDSGDNPEAEEEAAVEEVEAVEVEVEAVEEEGAEDKPNNPSPLPPTFEQLDLRLLYSTETEPKPTTG
jgi:hypothetical protein